MFQTAGHLATQGNVDSRLRTERLQNSVCRVIQPPSPLKKKFLICTCSWMLILGIGSIGDVFPFRCFSLHSHLSSRGMIVCNIPLERIVPGKFSHLKRKALSAFVNLSPCCRLVLREGRPGQAEPREGTHPQLGRLHPQSEPQVSRHYLRGGGRWRGPQHTAPLTESGPCCVIFWGNDTYRMISSKQPFRVNVRADGFTWGV